MNETLTDQIVELLPYKVKDIGLSKDGRKALEIAEKIKDFRRIWSCKSNIAGNHLALGNINRSEKLYIETLNISEQLGISDFKASSLSSFWLRSSPNLIM